MLHTSKGMPYTSNDSPHTIRSVHTIDGLPNIKYDLAHNISSPYSSVVTYLQRSVTQQY